MNMRTISPPFLQIVGSGAIGSLVAAGAEKAQVVYGLAPRDKSPATQSVQLHNGEKIDLGSNEGQRNKLGEQDILLLPLKVYQLNTAARYWRKRVAPRTPVILLHNGMGGFEQVRDYFTSQPIILGTTSHGAMRTRSGVCHTGLGNTFLGPAPGSVVAPSQRNHIVSTFSSCLPQVSWRGDIMEALWEKLAVNAVINPLTAINNVANGELASDSYQSQIAQICAEVAAVMGAGGYPVQSKAIYHKVLQVIKATATNYSSMQQDVENHRPTEIDAINGYIIQQAQKKGIEVPLNTLLYKEVVKRSRARLL